MPKKLGLGFACIEGDRTDFKGVNVRSPGGEQSGNGVKSKAVRKASLTVAGVEKSPPK